MSKNETLEALEGLMANRTRGVHRQRVLVWARHTKKWEAAHPERIDDQWFWVRDGMSMICRMGEEVATHPLPPKPAITPES